MELERPAFFEGQILAAADLTSTVEYGRGHDARHGRLLHDWGIVQGLALQRVKRSEGGTDYVEVTVEPGVALDGTGRLVVVPTPVRLDTARFEQTNKAGFKADAFYPVLLQGLDQDAPQPAFAPGSCAGNGHPTRIQEAFEVVFGRLDSERGLDQQPPPDVATGPGPVGGRIWSILLGFVQYDMTIHQFTKAEPEANGFRRRYVGVRADRVAARGGRLELRPNPERLAGEPAVLLGGDPAKLVFGVYDGRGDVEARLTVTADGDLTAEGTINGKLTVGETRVQSGVATDGVILPLPPGVTEQQVRDGDATLHIWVTPHNPPSNPPLQGDVARSVLECGVDGDRRLRCLVRWFVISTTTLADRPGAADYLIVATTPAKGATP